MRLQDAKKSRRGRPWLTGSRIIDWYRDAHYSKQVFVLGTIAMIVAGIGRSILETFWELDSIAGMIGGCVIVAIVGPIMWIALRKIPITWSFILWIFRGR